MEGKSLIGSIPFGGSRFVGMISYLDLNGRDAFFVLLTSLRVTLLDRVESLRLPISKLLSLSEVMAHGLLNRSVFPCSRTFDVGCVGISTLGA